MNCPGLTSHSAIGIDVGSHSIKAIQLRYARTTGWRIFAAAQVPRREAGDALNVDAAFALREILARQDFVGERIVIAAPTKQLVTDVLDLPPRESGAPIEQLARMELSRNHKLDAERLSLACWDVPAAQRGSSGTSVIAVALRHEDADRLIDPLETAGLEVVAIDARANALARVASLSAAAEGVTALLDLGHAAAMIVLIRQGVVIYKRQLVEAGIAALVSALKAEFNLDGREVEHLLTSGIARAGAGAAQVRAQALVLRHFDLINEEIDAALQYAKHRHAQAAVSELLLSGGGSMIAGIDTPISAKLGVPSRILGVAERVEIPRSDAARFQSGLFALALGLAGHGIL